MSTVRSCNPYRPLPEPFAATLRGEWPASTVNGLILAARLKGWSLRSIGDGLGITGEGVRLRSTRTNTQYALSRMDEVPDVPVPESLPPKEVPIRRRDVPEAEAAELRRLNDIARHVNGSASAHDPRRKASVELAYRFATLLDRGYNPTRIGKAAGVSRAAVLMRVRRHGYAPLWRSQADQYRGYAWYEETEEAS